MGKRCPSCEEERDFSMFGKNAGARDGLQHFCTPCRAAKHRAKKIALGQSVKPDVPKRTKAERNADALARYHRNKERIAKRRKDEYEHIVLIERASRLRRKDHQRPLKNERQMRRYRVQQEKTFTILPKELKKLYSAPCSNCGSNENQSLDHIIPLSRGGSHSIGNLMTLCRSCNSSKHARTLMEWRKAKSLVAA
jgi:5-methylcytosine-specific restriction endonuclease McrA